MTTRFPAPLRPGDRVGVTPPSTGVPADVRARLDFAIERVRARGYEVLVGQCMDGARHVSAPAADRARELTDPSIRAIVAPWGGETAIDLLDIPYRPPQGLLSCLDIVAMEPGSSFTRSPTGRYRAEGYDDYRTRPEVGEFTLDAYGRWARLDGSGDVDVTGRLIGGLGVPIIADVDCGHVPPFMPIVNGAVGRVIHTADRNTLTQTLAWENGTS